MRGDDEQRVEVHGDHHFNSRLYMRGNLGHICIVIVNGNFNSRLCTRGDIDFNTHLLCKRYFNSRLYTRGDVSHSIVLPVVEDILIHTSTWEATSVAESNSFVPIYFNSRLCMRGNVLSAFFIMNLVLFQFSPLHERQHCANRRGMIRYNFNSRLCMRGNCDDPLSWCKSTISIHASTWEAT